MSYERSRHPQRYQAREVRVGSAGRRRRRERQRRVLREVTAVRATQDYVALPSYHALPPQTPSATVREYRDEKDFWAEALGDAKPGQRLEAGDQVTLRRFRLSTWAPRVPGLYWKAESRRLRQLRRASVCAGRRIGHLHRGREDAAGAGGRGQRPPAAGRVRPGDLRFLFRPLRRGVPVLVRARRVAGVRRCAGRAGMRPDRRLDADAG